MQQPTTLRTRLTMMVTGWGTVGLAYSFGCLAPGSAHLLHESALDRMVPFDVSAIWLYLSFFAFIPVTYLYAAPQRLLPLMRAMQLCALVAGVVFFCWPTTLIYPPIPAGTADSAVLRLLAGSDTAQNCLPSLHGALTLLCIVAMWERRRPWRTIAMLLWGLTITWSVIQTRRHVAVDLGAGIALGALNAWLASRLVARFVARPATDARTSLDSSLETGS